MRFSPDERRDMETSFSLASYKAKSFLNPSLLQNMAKNARKPSVVPMEF
jgi:hypothetical protein